LSNNEHYGLDERAWAVLRHQQTVWFGGYFSEAGGTAASRIAALWVEWIFTDGFQTH
jgi:hypothetical protein